MQLKVKGRVSEEKLKGKPLAKSRHVAASHEMGGFMC